MAFDPTLEFLKSFEDESKWEIVPNVPLMTPHERLNPDGTLKYKVTEQKLKAIVAELDALEQDSGVLPKIQAGHTTKEGTGPEILGYVKNRRVGEWGPKQKTGLLGDLWLYKDKAPKAAGLPFRSAEFYPTRNQISAVALLSRDPELDMGTVSLSRGEEVEYYHLKEAPMPETKVETKPEVKPEAPVAVARDLTVETQVRMAREEMAVEYKRATDQIQRLEKELEAEKYHRREATAEQQVTQLRAEGYIIKDTAKLVKRLAGLNDDAVKEELATIRENYQRAPIDQPPVRVGEVVTNDKPQMSREDYQRVVSIATAENISFDEALKKFKGAAN